MQQQAINKNDSVEKYFTNSTKTIGKHKSASSEDMELNYSQEITDEHQMETNVTSQERFSIFPFDETCL